MKHSSRQVPGNCFGTRVYRSPKPGEQTAHSNRSQSSVRKSGNLPLYKEPITQRTARIFVFQLKSCLLFGAQHAQRPVGGGDCAALARTASNLWLSLRCNMHVLRELCSATREQIQSTYATSNDSSPSPCSPERGSLLRVNLAAAMGVCSDVNAVSHYCFIWH